VKVGEWFRRMPWTIVVCALGLMTLGVTGIMRGDELSSAGVFSGKQIVWILLSIPAMVAATLIPYRSLRRWSYPLFAISLALLVAVFFLPARNGAKRWIPLGIMHFQPSELAKLAFIMTLAHYLMYRKNYRRLTGLLIPFILTLLPMVLILREPDLGTSMLFLPILFAMLFAAGARPRHLAFVVVMGVAVLPALWLGMTAEQKSRVVTLFVQSDGGPVPKGDGYHLHQSKQMLALGGAWGSDIQGVSLDDPRAYHLPAGRTDFVYCLVGERFGLMGTVITLLLYLVLIGRGLCIAGATREPFGRLLVVGIVSLLAAQMIINAGMTVGMMPITGMTLPLMSYGGSSLLATAISLGLLINVGMRPGYEMTADPFRFRAGE
jgi:rod shape determining protein RodA